MASSDSSAPGSNTSTENPSMLRGHANYVAGAVKETLGYESGAADKEAAVGEMRAAREQSEGEPAKSGVLGGVEEMAGKATGCEGMKEEGKERQS